MRQAASIKARYTKSSRSTSRAFIRSNTSKARDNNNNWVDLRSFSTLRVEAMEESVRIRPDNGAAGDNIGVVADSVDRVGDVLDEVVGVAVEVPVEVSGVPGVPGVRWGRVGSIGEAGDAAGDAVGDAAEEGMDGGLRVSDSARSVFMGGDSVVGGARSPKNSKSCWSAPSKLLENLLDVLLVLGLSLPRTLSYRMGEDR